MGLKASDVEKRIIDLKSKQSIAKKACENAGNKDLLKFLVEIIPMALNAERCGIFILNPDGQKVWMQCGTGMDENEVVVLKGSSMVGLVMSSGEAIIDQDLKSSLGEHEIIAMRTGFVAYDAICVPIFGSKNKEVIGAIQVLNKKLQAYWGKEDLNIIEKMALAIRHNIGDIFLRQDMEKINIEVGKKIKELEELITTAKQ